MIFQGFHEICMTLVLMFDIFQSIIGNGFAGRPNALIGSSRTGEVDFKMWSKSPSKNNDSCILESQDNRYF